MQLTLGFSPCPNDTFIFDALVNSKIDTGELRFNVVLEEVQTLNEWAKEERLDVSKISYGVLPLVLPRYRLLESGGALGQGVGPLLIGRKPLEAGQTMEQLTIAIPGKDTTAHLLFSLAFPHASQKVFKVFHEIEHAVLHGEVDAGVIIHENRFTYQQKGLVKWMDLGEYWEQQTGAPIPLGGIVARKSLPAGITARVDALIRTSLEHAFSHYPELSAYVRAHAQEMNEQVMRQHIDLYVNDFSLGLGSSGKKAIDTLLQVYHRLHGTHPAGEAVTG